MKVSLTGRNIEEVFCKVKGQILMDKSYNIHFVHP